MAISRPVIEGVIAAIFVGLLSWGGITLVDIKSQLSGLEQNNHDMKDRFDRMVAAIPDWKVRVDLADMERPAEGLLFTEYNGTRKNADSGRVVFVDFPKGESYIYALPGSLLQSRDFKLKLRGALASPDMDAKSLAQLQSFAVDSNKNIDWPASISPTDSFEINFIDASADRQAMIKSAIVAASQDENVRVREFDLSDTGLVSSFNLFSDIPALVDKVSKADDKGWKGQLIKPHRF